MGGHDPGDLFEDWHGHAVPKLPVGLGVAYLPARLIWYDEAFRVTHDPSALSGGQPARVLARLGNQYLRPILVVAGG